jgi:poly(A) polymerase Pap1
VTLQSKAMTSLSSSTPFAANKQNKQTRRRQKAGASDRPGVLEEAVAEIETYKGSDYHSRRLALDYLEKILARWAMAARTINSNAHSFPENPWQTPRVTLVSIGSFRLGVHRKSSDLDVLAIAPPSCTRKDFFTSLVDMLKSDPLIDQVHPIPTAYTPVIKFLLKGYQIDMLFARVDNPSKLLAFQRQRVSPLVTTQLVSSTPRVEYIIDDRDLVGLDEAGVRSMNGARVCQMLQEMVPDYKAYMTVLKAVKEWAHQSGIYSNVLGTLRLFSFFERCSSSNVVLLLIFHRLSWWYKLGNSCCLGMQKPSSC